MHRIAIMSKDGDWIIREDDECLKHILSVLEKKGAGYRFGAPLDVRWLSGGWSSHLEYRQDKLRMRVDFVTRPPRISDKDIGLIWAYAEKMELPFVNEVNLAEIKKTAREKDYLFIGELARRMRSIDDQLLYSRSAGDIIRISQSHPRAFKKAALTRPLIERALDGKETLEAALDAERRQIMRADTERLQVYVNASRQWRSRWGEIEEEAGALPLKSAHKKIVAEAEKILPFAPLLAKDIGTTYGR